MLTRLNLFAAILAVLLTASACGSSGSDDALVSTESDTTTTSEDSTSEDDSSSGNETATAADGVDLALFVDGALAEEVTTEDCTLNGGAETTCYSITIAGYPASHDVGPFCPGTITDSAS